MNLVQEMPRLQDLNRLPEAIDRLSGLLERMKQQPGFLSAEVLQGTASPLTLLVLHAWRDLGDWQTYQTSAEKVAFTASRPAGLYEMVECGMNWRSLQADGERSGGLFRREVIRGEDAALRQGEGISGCQTFLYQDELPAWAGCTLRLTRLRETTRRDSVEPAAMVDDTFHSLVVVTAATARA